MGARRHSPQEPARAEAFRGSVWPSMWSEVARLAERFEVVREAWDTESPPDSMAVPRRARDAQLSASIPTHENLTLPAPTGWSDGLTDTDGPRLWEKLLAAEQARNLRHERTSTIVLVEVVGMRAIVERWGAALAIQQFVTLARFIAADIRKSDHIARIRPATFGVLLTETDEISSINFVDRMRERCTSAFDPATMGLRIAVGWASPPKGGRLDDAMAVAEQRLTVELSASR